MGTRAAAGGSRTHAAATRLRQDGRRGGPLLLVSLGGGDSRRGPIVGFTDGAWPTRPTASAWSSCCQEWALRGRGEFLNYEPTSADWYDLLGVSNAIDGVFAGTVTITSALGDLNAARSRWPGVSQDWIAVVDAAIEQVQRLRAVAQAQVAAMARLEESLGTAAGPDASYYPPPLPYPVDRVLTAAELAILENVPEWYRNIAAEHEREEADAEVEEEQAYSDYLQAEQDYEDAVAELDSNGPDDSGGDDEW